MTHSFLFQVGVADPGCLAHLEGSLEHITKIELPLGEDANVVLKRLHS